MLCVGIEMKLDACGLRHLEWNAPAESCVGSSLLIHPSNTAPYIVGVHAAVAGQPRYRYQKCWRFFRWIVKSVSGDVSWWLVPWLSHFVWIINIIIQFTCAHNKIKSALFAQCIWVQFALTYWVHVFHWRGVGYPFNKAHLKFKKWGGRGGGLLLIFRLFSEQTCHLWSNEQSFV